MSQLQALLCTHMTHSYEILSPRLTIFRLDLLFRKPIGIINCYPPVSAGDQTELYAFQELEEVIRTDKLLYTLVIVGFNAKIGTVFENMVQRSGASKR